MLITGVKLLRLEYETGGNLYKTTVATDSLDSALRLLKENIKGEFRITMSEDLGILNALTPKIVDAVVRARVPKPEPEKQPDAPKRRRRKKV